MQPTPPEKTNNPRTAATAARTARLLIRITAIVADLRALAAVADPTVTPDTPADDLLAPIRQALADACPRAELSDLENRLVAVLSSLDNDLDNLAQKVHTLADTATDLADQIDGERYASEIYETWDPSVRTLSKTYYGDTRLRRFPAVDISNVTEINQLFTNCINLRHLPPLDTSHIKTWNWNNFYGCAQLRTLPPLDFSSCTLMNNPLGGLENLTALPPLTMPRQDCATRGFFFQCRALQEIPALDTSHLTSMTSFVRDCTSLRHLPALDTSRCTKFDSFAYGCTALLDFPELDTSRATTINTMLAYCTSITTLPPLDLANVVDAAYAFANMDSLTAIPPLDLSSATDLTETFRTLPRCHTIGPVDIASAQTLSNILYSCPELTACTLLNLGKAPQLTTATLIGAPRWGSGSDHNRQTLLDTLLTHSFDRAAASYPVCRISLLIANKALLTSAEKAAITARGYTIA